MQPSSTSANTRKRVLLSGQVSNQKVNIQGTFCIQAQISNSFAEATKPRCWHFCAGKMGTSATQQVRDVLNILPYRFVLHRMNKREVSRTREVKPSHTVDLSLVEPHGMQEGKQLFPKSCEHLEVRLLSIREPWKINKKTNLASNIISPGGQGCGATHILKTSRLTPVVGS